MLFAIYLLLLPACSLTMGLFGFFVGRCARKLPILDNNLPWAMHRSQVPFTLEDSQHPLIQANYPQASNPGSHSDWASLITDSPHHADHTLYVVAEKFDDGFRAYRPADLARHPRLAMVTLSDWHGTVGCRSPNSGLLCGDRLMPARVSGGHCCEMIGARGLSAVKGRHGVEQLPLLAEMTQSRPPVTRGRCYGGS